MTKDSSRQNMRDEQALTDRFERLCGSIERAQRMLRLWQNSCPSRHPNPRWSKTKEQVFETKAKEEGYTRKHIQAFYACR